MLRKEETNQLELFQGQGGATGEKAGYSRLFQKFIWNYEKTILIIIGFLITGVISFSMGVEKGKKIIALKNNAKFDFVQKAEPPKKVAAPTQKIPQTNTTIEQILPVNTKVEKIIIEADTVKTAGKYTIQVASFATKNNANKEAANLEKKGMNALILSKGEYIIVCVGSFSSWQDAKTQLTKLKNNYRDCYIRRL